MSYKSQQATNQALGRVWRSIDHITQKGPNSAFLSTEDAYEIRQENSYHIL